MFEYTVTARDRKTAARVGEYNTPHGTLQTPDLAIVATDGEIKGVPAEFHASLPITYLIVNTFHIFTKEILGSVQESGGIHTYARFGNTTVASDSGGFQVFSLGFGKAHQVSKVGGFFPGQEQTASDEDNPISIDDHGVEFRFNNKPVKLTPELSMSIQHGIGADIMFAFDECTSPLNSEAYTARALERTHAWIHDCIAAHRGFEEKQALFAIVQGGFFEGLRKQSAAYMGKLDVPGFGIGGSLGKTKDDMYRILDWTIPLLPDEKPRHLLGIGQVKDIFEAVERGVDLFDCVIPTREARHKMLYTKKGKRPVKIARATDELLDPGCACYACSEGITYAKLAQLFMERNPMAFLFATVHNIAFFTSLMAEIRTAIAAGTFTELKEQYLKYY